MIMFQWFNGVSRGFTGVSRFGLHGGFRRVSRDLSVFYPCKPAENGVSRVYPYYVRECEPVKRFSHPPVAT